MKTSCVALLITFCLGAGSTAAEQANFIPSSSESAGWVNLEPKAGGQYIYQDTPNDNRPAINPILMQERERTEFVFFSPQEQFALESLRERKLSQWEKQFRSSNRFHRRSFFLNLAWPKVVIRENEICVPELAFSEQKNWKDHLTCWSNELEVKSDGK